MGAAVMFFTIFMIWQQNKRTVGPETNEESSIMSFDLLLLRHAKQNTITADAIVVHIKYHIYDSFVSVIEMHVQILFFEKGFSAEPACPLGGSVLKL